MSTRGKVLFVIITVLVVICGEKTYPISLQIEHAALEKSNDTEKSDLENRVSVALDLLVQKKVQEALLSAQDIVATYPNDSVGYVILGMALAGKDEVDKAIASYEKALAINPKEARAYTQLGLLYYSKKGNLQKAKENLLKAVELNHGDLNAHKLLSIIYIASGDESSALVHIKKGLPPAEDKDARIVLASYYLDTGKPEKAIDTCTKILTEKPDSVDAMLLLGQAYIATNAIDKAIGELEKALNQDNTNINAYLLLSRAYELKKDDEKALDFLEKAANIQPTNPIPIINLGDYYVRKRKLEQALDQFTEAERLDKMNLGIKTKLALIFQELGEHDKAVVKLLEIRKIGGFIPQNELKLAYSYTKLNDYVQAQKTYIDILKKDHDNPQALIGFANLLYDLNKYIEAAQVYNRIIKNKMGGLIEHDAYVQLAVLSSLKDQYTDVEKLLREGLARFPKSVVLNLNLGKTLVKLGKADEAVALFENLIKSTPDRAEYHFGLGFAYYAKQNFKETQTQMLKALEIQPRYFDAISLLASTYWTQKDKTGTFNLLKDKINAFPNQVDIQLLLAQYYQQDNDSDDATQIYEKLLKNTSPNLEILVAASTFYSDIKMTPKTIELLEKAAELYPQSPEPFFRLGMLYESLENKEKALKYYLDAVKINDQNPLLLNNLAWLMATTRNNLLAAKEFALRAQGISPQNPAILDTLGWIYYLLDDYTNAKSYIEKAAELAPKVSVIQYHVGKLYMTMGKLQDAETAFNRALELSGNGKTEEKNDILKSLESLKKISSTVQKY